MFMYRHPCVRFLYGMRMRKKPPTRLRVQLGKAIRALRNDQRISLRKFGLMTGMDYQYISLIERGQANASVDALEKIASGLDVEVRDLFNQAAE